VYLHDIELKAALKKITTADEMEEFLKARYKTKKEERSPSKRKLNRITSNTSRTTARSTIEKTPAGIAPTSIEEEERVPSNQQRQQTQQEQPAGEQPVSAEPSKVSSLFEKARRGEKLSSEELGEVFEGKTDQQQLSIAVGLGQEEVIKKLISGSTVDINAPDPEYDGKTPLMLAAINGSIASLEVLLDAKVDVNKAHAETKETALMIASQQPDGVHFIKKLFETADSKNQYVKIDAGDRSKQTALMHAAIKGRYNNVCILLGAGADLNAADINGQTALMHSAMQGFYRNVDILLQKKAVINCRDYDGRTSLMHAAAQGSCENVRALIDYSNDKYDKSSSIISRDKNGWTALIHAATKGNLEIVHTLIDHGALFSGNSYKLIKEVEAALEEAKKNDDATLVLPLNEVLEEVKVQNERIDKERRAAERRWEEKDDDNDVAVVDDFDSDDCDIIKKVEKSPQQKVRKQIDNRRKKKLQNGGGESIPITVDLPDLKSHAELLEIVHKATVDGKLLETTEIDTLLGSAAQLPLSTCPPSLPAAGALFLYDKAATPHYKRDEHNFGKESHNKLVIDKQPRIKVYYGTNKDPPLQRRSYFLNVDTARESRGRGDAGRPQELVIVHYLVPQASAPKGNSQKSTKSEGQVASGSFDETVIPLSNINEEEDRPHKRRKLADEPLKPDEQDVPLHSYPPPSSLAPHSEIENSALRSLICIGVRLQIPELDLEAICDDVNDLCDKPPAGCEAASKSSRINYHTLDIAAQELSNVKFDFIEAEMEKKWKKAVADNESSGLIKKLCSVVVEHFSVVSSDVRKALESAEVDEEASMATALRKLGKIDSIPKKELMQLVGIVTVAPLEWARKQFKVIRDAVLDDDIEFAKALIHSALENKPGKGYI